MSSNLEFIASGINLDIKYYYITIVLLISYTNILPWMGMEDWWLDKQTDRHSKYKATATAIVINQTQEDYTNN